MGRARSGSNSGSPRTVQQTGVQMRQADVPCVPRAIHSRVQLDFVCRMPSGKIGLAVRHQQNSRRLSIQHSEEGATPRCV